jgi:mannosyl-3-phosphoglycerate phosphatase
VRSAVSLTIRPGLVKFSISLCQTGLPFRIQHPAFRGTARCLLIALPVSFQYRVAMTKSRLTDSQSTELRPPIVVFTDLDGTLLDAAYSFDAAEDALRVLRERDIPMVLVSSKTRAEIEILRASLQNGHPFIVENGGAVYIPAGLFPFPVEGSTRRDRYQVVELGVPYSSLRRALQEIRHNLGHEIRGFGDLSVEEIAEQTGLPIEEARLARRREYDEPLVLTGSSEQVEDFRRHAVARGLRCVRGGRFFHLMGETDKGRACRLLIDLYRRQFTFGQPVTVGIGDSLNDLAMLTVMDRPILVQRPDGSYDPEVRLTDLSYAPGIGPVGWNRAILSLFTSH